MAHEKAKKIANRTAGAAGGTVRGILKVLLTILLIILLTGLLFIVLPIRPLALSATLEDPTRRHGSPRFPN